MYVIPFIGYSHGAAKVSDNAQTAVFTCVEGCKTSKTFGSDADAVIDSEILSTILINTQVYIAADMLACIFSQRLANKNADFY